MPHEKNHPYRTYLMRCWQEGEATPGEDPHWRFWLEEIARERSQKGFNSLEAVFAYLQAELDPMLDDEQSPRKLE